MLIFILDHKVELYFNIWETIKKKSVYSLMSQSQQLKQQFILLYYSGNEGSWISWVWLQQLWCWKKIVKSKNAQRRWVPATNWTQADAPQLHGKTLQVFIFCTDTTLQHHLADFWV